jgi:hypothetical protein
MKKTPASLRSDPWLFCSGGVAGLNGIPSKAGKSGTKNKIGAEIVAKDGRYFIDSLVLPGYADRFPVSGKPY